MFEPIQPQVIVWQSLWTQPEDRAALEYLQLQPNAACGSILGHADTGGPFRLEYEVDWDDGWRTSGVRVAVARHGESRRLHLKERAGRWLTEEGEELTSVRGCVDVDVWPTPFTNSLPIRRLQLKMGERRQIDVLYVDGLELSVDKAVQAYTRTGRRSFRFESVGTDFIAELTVDDRGLVWEYPGLFRRLGARDPGKRTG